MKQKLIFILLFLVAILIVWFSLSKAEDIKPYDTLSLSIQTGINGTIAPWDSCVCLIVHTGNGVPSVIGRTKLTATTYGSMIAAGIYRGQWFANGSRRGSYLREYYCWYGSDVVGDIPMPFGIVDTSLYFLASSGSGGACGTGLYACTLQVRDSALTAGIRDVHIYLMNSGQTSKVLEGYTNSNGLLKFALDSLNTGTTYKVWLKSRSDYLFAFPESTSSNHNHGQKYTFYGTSFASGTPSPDSTCNVWGVVYNPSQSELSGVIVSARVYVSGDSILTYKGYQVSPFAVFDTTNSAGQWNLPLIPNSKLKPDSTKYIFNFNYPKTWAGYLHKQDQDTLTVPAQDTIFYGTLRGR